MKSLNIKYIIWSNSEGTLTKCRVRDYTTDHISQGNKFIERGMVPREKMKNHKLKPKPKPKNKTKN